MGQVLLVDDDPAQLQVRELILRSRRIAVCTATSVAEALALLGSEGNGVGMVVTDHNLPGRSGVDLVRELRATRPALPVLILTGMPGIEDEYDGLDVTVRTKPFPAEELIKLVQSFLMHA